MHEGKQVFPEEKKRFVTALDPSKCLKQIKNERLPLKYTPISELQSYISPMGWILLFCLLPGKSEAFALIELYKMLEIKHCMNNNNNN